VATRQLILVRHAKASDDGATDLQRPLSGRGRRDAAAIGAALAALDAPIDRAAVSPALRARQTWDAARAALPGEVSTDVDDRIYDNTVAALLAVVNDTADTVRALAIIGHNPSLAEFAGEIDDGAGDADARTRLAGGLSTAAVAVFDVAVEWADVRAGAGTLRHLTVPRGD
jgi:phosphohistidine phosphatase